MYCLSAKYCCTLLMWASVTSLTSRVQHAASEPGFRSSFTIQGNTRTQVQHLIVWLQNPVLLSLVHNSQNLGEQSSSHPSWPKAMFSSILELSSLSSWVMWHHFSLEHRTEHGWGQAWSHPMIFGEPPGQCGTVSPVSAELPKQRCCSQSTAAIFFFLLSLYQGCVLQSEGLQKAFFSEQSLWFTALQHFLEIAGKKVFNIVVLVAHIACVSHFFCWRELQFVIGKGDL